MIELYVLKSLLSRNIFLEYNYLLDDYFLKEEQEETFLIYQSIKDFYRKSSEGDIGSVDTLEQLFHAAYPAIPKKKREVYTPLFDRLRALILNPEQSEGYFRGLSRKHLFRKIAAESINLTQGRGNEESLKELYGRLDRFSTAAIRGHSPLLSRSYDLEKLLSPETAPVGSVLHLRSETLQHSLGPLRTGDFGVVVARPEVGKTTFLADTAAHILSQVETCVVYVANEERGAQVYKRIIQSYFGWTAKELRDRREEAIAEYHRIFKQKLIFLHEPSLTYKELYALLREVKPNLILVDQLDKLKGFEDDRYDLELGALYRWARETSHEFGPFIGATQASAEAEGKKWLEQSYIANSKTAKPAEADWILGIGKTHESALERIRHFHLIKNKLEGDENTINQFRHGKFDMRIEPEIVRYEDTMDWDIIEQNSHV